MFDLTHILYTLISAALTVLGLYLAKQYCKTEEAKDRILKISAVTTVIIHYSSIWVDYFSNGGHAEIENNQILMVYPCNIIMWFLLIFAFSKKKHSKFMTMFSEFTFWVGSVCGIVGIVFNTNYHNNPNLLDYDILKGLLSHSTMVFGCLFIFFGGYIKVRAFNAVSCLAGLLFFIADGLFINTIFDIFDIPSVNAMFMNEPLFPDYPWISVYLLGFIALLIFFGALALYEQILFPENERWYKKIHHLIETIKTTSEEK